MGNAKGMRDVLPRAQDAVAESGALDRARLLHGAHAADGDSHGDEVGASQHVAAVGSAVDPQFNTAFMGDPLGVAGHRLCHFGIDVDQGDRRVRKERGSSQIGDEAGGENRAARTDDDDFHVRLS